jgi:hypothetical protein
MFLNMECLMMSNKASDLALLIMLAITILFFVGSKIMISNCLDKLNNYRIYNEIIDIIESNEGPHCYETTA